MVGGSRSIPRRKTCRLGIIILALHNSVESPDIEFLMILKDIPKFENLNNISMNMYNIEDKQVLLLRLTNDKRDKHVNLLYLPDSHNGNIKHFAWIKNLFL